MEVVEEELNVYAISVYTENPYFISVEYPTLRHNTPRSFLPLQIRDQDGKKTIYYEITGRSSLADRGEHGNLTYQECYFIVDGLYTLFQDLEKYMLSVQQISFHKEDIYADVVGHIRFIYRSSSTGDIRTQIEELFLWMLSIVDYEDKKALDMIYRLFNYIKKDTLNKEFLAEILGKAVEDNAEKPLKSPQEHDWKAAFDSSIYEETGDSITYNETEHNDKKNLSKKQKGGIPFKKIIPGGFSAITFLAAGYIGYCIYLRGTTPFLVICFTVTIAILAILLRFLFIAVRATDHSNPKKGTYPKKDHGGKGKTDIQNQEESHRIISESRSIFEELEDHWENGDETVLISNVRKKKDPVLQSKESDERIELKVFPFYIGSEEGLNQLPLHNRAVSRQHAVILRGEEERYYLEDMNSKNGTIVDDMNVIPEKTVSLKDGSRIIFADEEWVFSFE